MLTRHTILCPVDFSEYSRHALRWAQVLAVRYQSRLIVLTVVERLLADAAKIRFDVELVNAETVALRDFVRGAEAESPVANDRLTLKVGIGEAPGIIVETARENAVDLIVMGTHGLSGFRKWFIGSTTERVLGRTEVPVLGIPPAADEPDIPPDGNAPIHMVRVLAATDFRDSSVAAVAWASEFARHFHLVLLLAHVVEPVVVPSRWQSYVKEADEERIADARARLGRATHELCRGQSCDTVVRLGRPEESIPAIAKEHGADLIVMGLGGRPDGFGRRPGSIAYAVLRASSVPVLMVPVSSAPPR